MGTETGVDPEHAEALRLELQDLQSEIIATWCGSKLDRAGASAQGLPEAWRIEALTRAGHGPCADAEWELRAARELYRVNRAILRLERGVYGLCERCGEPIRLALLLRDASRYLCPGCERGESD